MRSKSRKSRKKKKERWNWDDQSKAVMTPMTEKMTFKQYLNEFDHDWDRGINYGGPSRSEVPDVS